MHIGWPPPRYGAARSRPAMLVKPYGREHAREDVGLHGLDGECGPIGTARTIEGARRLTWHTRLGASHLREPEGAAARPGSGLPATRLMGRRWPAGRASGSALLCVRFGRAAPGRRQPATSPTQGIAPAIERAACEQSIRGPTAACCLAPQGLGGDRIAGRGECGGSRIAGQKGILIAREQSWDRGWNRGRHLVTIGRHAAARGCNGNLIGAFRGTQNTHEIPHGTIILWGISWLGDARRGSRFRLSRRSSRAPSDGVWSAKPRGAWLPALHSGAPHQRVGAAGVPVLPIACW